MIRQLRQTILILGDISAAYLSLFLTLIIGFWPNFNWEVLSVHFFPFSTLYLCWLSILYIFDLYNLNTSRNKLLFYPKFIQALSVSGTLGIAFFYLWSAFGITPKTNLILNILFFGMLIVAWRKIFYSLFSKKLLLNVAILGKSNQVKILSQEIIERPYLGYKLKKVYITSGNLFSLAGVEASPLKENLTWELKKENIETLIVAESLENNSEMTAMLYQCLQARINFWDISQAYEIICKKIPIGSIDKIWFLENLKEGEKSFQDKIKRATDIIFSFSLALTSLPLWLLIAITIKIQDGGPVFYKQIRVGRDKKEFWLWKFRSMKVNAEKQGKAVWAKEKDPRITFIGNILRNSHLDELPQVINVLKGEISLVGPRPERPEFVKELESQIPHYNLRHLIKPGITGWDQIKFKYARTISDSFEKFEYDLYYLKNRNLFLDFGIILKTFQSFFKRS